MDFVSYYFKRQPIYLSSNYLFIMKNWFEKQSWQSSLIIMINHQMLKCLCDQSLFSYFKQIQFSAEIDQMKYLLSKKYFPWRQNQNLMSSFVQSSQFNLMFIIINYSFGFMYFNFKFNFSYLLSLIYYLFHSFMMRNHQQSWFDFKCCFNFKYYFAVKHFNYLFDLNFNLINFMCCYFVKQLSCLFDYQIRLINFNYCIMIDWFIV